MLYGAGSYANKPVDDNGKPQQEEENEGSLLQPWHPDIGDHRKESGKHSKGYQERAR